MIAGIELEVLWFVVVGVLFAGYFLLEGFDFGVGMLLPILGRDERRRSAVITTIGPVWDGNEVWLITAAGAMFAAFPEWYATMFSGLYLPLFLIILALIVRAVALEWRSKVHSDRWRRWCDAGIVTGSVVTPFVWGVAFTAMLAGLPVGEGHHLGSGGDTLVRLVHPYPLLGGLAFVLLFLLHGLTFVRLKTTGALREEAGRLSLPVGGLAAIAGIALLLWTQIAFGKGWTWVPAILGIVAVAAAVAGLLRHRDGIAFVATSIGTLGVSALLFGSLYPNLMPSSLADSLSLDLYAGASSDYTLVVLTWVAAFITPVVILYQGWTYWVFRKRISADPVGLGAGSPAPAGDAASADGDDSARA